MGDKTGISWTQRTWNPWIGCHKVSPGCTNCYAEHIVEVFPMAKGKGAFRKLWRTETWGDPVKWNRAAAAAGRRELVFTCSMSDFFHPDADAWRAEAWALIRSTPNLEYQVLTKRPERIAACLPADWGAGYANVWLGTSVETQKYANLRIPDLLSVPAKVHFLSCEPLLGRVNLRAMTGFCVGHVDALEDAPPKDGMPRVDWVIVGGESGPGFRPMQTEWAWDLWSQCDATGVAFFGKQRSAVKNEQPLLINGREWKEFPRAWQPKQPNQGQQALELEV